MATGNNDQNAPPSVDELYSVAISTSNLRVGNDSTIRTPGDIIAAAGMTKARLGMALRRLRQEWDKSAKPRPMTPAQIDALSGTYKRLASGLVRVLVDERDPDGRLRQVERELKPLQAAIADSDKWVSNEHKLLMLSLRTLPEVRAALVFWARGHEIEDGEHAAGAAVMWWLEPRCPVCGGGGKKVVEGTGRQSSKDCKPCKGSGQRPIPHGPVGRRLIGYIGSSMGEATSELRGRFRHHSYTPPEADKE